MHIMPGECSRRDFVRLAAYGAISMQAIRLTAATTRAQSKKSAVLLVIDGLCADYVYPQTTPFAMDGTELLPATTWNAGLRVEDVTVPVPSTGPGHAVLFTGCSDADPAQVGYPGCSIFDAARENGCLAVAVLQKGDTRQVLDANDAAIHDARNSILNPGLHVVKRTGVPACVTDVLESYLDYMDPLLNGLDGSMRYAAYNRWAMHCACDLVATLATGDMPFLLTVNVGAVDSSGHYLGHGGYLHVIDELREDVAQLRENCAQHGIPLVVTADHGMSFPDSDRRGGHASSKYSDFKESRKIPFYVFAAGVDDGVLAGSYGQQDVAPTVLDLMGIAPALPLAGGCSVLTGCTPGQEIDFAGARVDADPSVQLLGGAALAAINAAGLGYVYRLYRGRQ